MNPPLCRFCGAPLTHDFVDLGETPLANAYVTVEQAAQGIDKTYPLHVRICSRCYLVQVDAHVNPREIFSHYAYFSSYADAWVEHARQYANSMISRLGLGSKSMVVEVASNDGYLLQHFLAAGIPVLGIEPALNVANAARARNVHTRVAFFDLETASEMAREGISADLMVANNVLAHVPDIAEFVGAFPIVLAQEGVVTFEFPHLLNLIREIQFDTIYHEHFSYLSLLVVEKVLTSAGLRAFDVDQLATHGGSLRVYACRTSASHGETEALKQMRQTEREAKLDQLSTYNGFAGKVESVKRSFQEFLACARAERKTVAAYGAAAKGNTFLNVCRLGSCDIASVFDRSKAKQGLLLPGSHIPIRPPEAIYEMKPDYLVILPWNLRKEIAQQMAFISEWRGKFVTAVPTVRVFDA